MAESFIKQIEDADMILVGLGEEFNDIKRLKNMEGYVAGKERIERTEALWLLPAYDELYREQCYNNNEDRIHDVLNKLAEVLQNKNYFIVSTANCNALWDIPWKDGRIVTPCGGIHKKQCIKGCGSGVQPTTIEDKEEIFSWLKQHIFDAEKEQNVILKDGEFPKLGICSECGTPLILNNIYAEHYDENGYIEQWQRYMKWLQGTLNKKLLILELGVGMKYPSVIRWPFEKVAFFNQKAQFYRINEKLYQLSEELSGKGTAIPKNSIDWLEGLC